jgi:hypothetical protein
MGTEASEIYEISNLLKRERYHRDTAQWDSCRAAFHPDASKTYVNVAWYGLLILLVITTVQEPRLNSIQVRGQCRRVPTQVSHDAQRKSQHHPLVL